MAFIKYLSGSVHHHFLYWFDPSEEFPPLCDSHGFFVNHSDKLLCARLFSCFIIFLIAIFALILLRNISVIFFGKKLINFHFFTSKIHANEVVSMHKEKCGCEFI